MNAPRFAAIFVLAFALGLWLFAPGGPQPGPDRSSAPASSSVVVENDNVLPKASSADRPDAPRRSPAPPDRKTADAQADDDPAAAGASNSPDVVREQAYQMLREQRVPEALSLLRRLAEIDPSADTHAELGRLYAKLTDIDSALYHLRRASQLDPGNADRWIELADAYYRKPDLGAAWNAEKMARQAEPGLELEHVDGGVRRGGDLAPAIP